MTLALRRGPRFPTVTPPWFDLSGRSALVTGGTSGIGLAIAETVAVANADVLIHGNAPQAQVNRISASLGRAPREARGRSLDLSQRDAPKTLADWAFVERGHIDVLVLSAPGG